MGRKSYIEDDNREQDEALCPSTRINLREVSQTTSERLCNDRIHPKNLFCTVYSVCHQFLNPIKDDRNCYPRAS